MFYPGHMMVPKEKQDEMMPAVNHAIEAAYEAITKAGLRIERVSGGSSPTAYRSGDFPLVTEIRPGMYPLNDRNLVHGGFAALEDCALTVLTTVVSTAVKHRVILDGGSKTFSSDRLLTGDHVGHGDISVDPDAIFFGLSEEHGHLDVSRSTRQYKLGERLHVLPNHVCAPPSTCTTPCMACAARRSSQRGTWRRAAACSKQKRGQHGILESRELERRYRWRGRPRSAGPRHCRLPPGAPHSRDGLCTNGEGVCGSS